jgi:hypothetical protein
LIGAGVGLGAVQLSVINSEIEINLLVILAQPAVEIQFCGCGSGSTSRWACAIPRRFDTSICLIGELIPQLSDWARAIGLVEGVFARLIHPDKAGVRYKTRQCIQCIHLIVLAILSGCVVNDGY